VFIILPETLSLIILHLYRPRLTGRIEGWDEDGFQIKWSRKI